MASAVRTDRDEASEDLLTSILAGSTFSSHDGAGLPLRVCAEHLTWLGARQEGEPPDVRRQGTKPVYAIQ